MELLIIFSLILFIGVVISAFCGNSSFAAAVGCALSFLLLIGSIGEYNNNGSANSITCPNCNNSVTTNFCPNCGWNTQDKLLCPNCEIEVVGKFCPNCGRSKQDIEEMKMVEYNEERYR